MPDKTSFTLSQAIAQVLARVQKPIYVDDFAKRVLAIYPSRAKNPLAALRSRLRLEYAGETLAFLDRQTLIPLRLAMQGVRFRISVSRQEAMRGVLLIDPAFDSFRRLGITPQDMRLLDAAGDPLKARVVTLKRRVRGPLGAFTQETPVFELGDWFRTHRIRRHDSVLATVEDWERGGPGANPEEEELLNETRAFFPQWSCPPSWLLYRTQSGHGPGGKLCCVSHRAGRGTRYGYRGCAVSPEHTGFS